MNCPNCKKWNRSGIDKCFYCATPLPLNIKKEPSWLEEFDGKVSDKKVIRVNDYGEELSNRDPRDVLAEDMAHLRTRKEEGKVAQEHFRKVAERRRSANRGRVGFAPKPLIDNKEVNILTKSSEFSNIVKEEMYNEPISDEEMAALENEKFKNYDLQNRSFGKLPIDDRFLHPKKKKKSKILRIIPILIILAVLVYGGYSLLQYRKAIIDSEKADKQARIIPSMLDDMAAHTIMIPGEEGEQIYIRELHNTYLVTNGYATVEVADYTWYESYEDYLEETMDVTITPFLKKTSGKQQPLDPVTYTIDIPLSPLDIITPQQLRDTVYTSLYNVELRVRENSRLTINGADYSDLVNANSGNVIFNAQLKPIGDNTFTITVRSQYCRSNTKVITINRPEQEIPVDLATDISSVSTYDYMTIKASTIPGAYISVQSPHSDLNITNIDRDGSFSFIALFDKIGDNVISFTASKPGMESTNIDYKIYYVPNIDIYSRKAWAMDDSHYAQLISTINLRAKNSQIYVCIGRIEEFIAQEPQIAIMNCGTEEKPIKILLENKTNKTWEVGNTYRVYADVTGLYKDIPRLIARYSYTD